MPMALVIDLPVPPPTLAAMVTLQAEVTEQRPAWDNTPAGDAGPVGLPRFFILLQVCHRARTTGRSLHDVV